MGADDRFKQKVTTTIAKRAANRCSNPDCGALTSGPTADPTGSINVGEAAHIYGANFGSARYDGDMASIDRSSITNAIWLCGNCHKMIDDDAIRFPAGLLFEWQKSHEQNIAIQVGKSGAEIRHRFEKRHLEDFGRLSYIAERLIIEKGEYWKYRLTHEVLRFEMIPVVRRWNALKRGLYMKPLRRIETSDFLIWIHDRNDEVKNIVEAFSVLINEEFSNSWDESNPHGNDIAIVETCRLFTELCRCCLEWEESIRFVSVDPEFKELISIFTGLAGNMIDEAQKIPTFLNERMSGVPEAGIHELNLKLELPAGWSEKAIAAYQRALVVQANMI